MFSSHSSSDSAGRSGSPWKGVRNCMMISGEDAQQEGEVLVVVEVLINSLKMFDADLLAPG